MEQIDFSQWGSEYDVMYPLSIAPPGEQGGIDLNEWLAKNKNLVYIAVGVAVFLAMRN